MTKVCRNCNQTNPPDAAFCLNCSSPIGPTVGGPAYQQQSPPQAAGQAPYVGAPPQAQGQNFGMQGSSQSGTGPKAIVALVLVIVGLIFCCGPFTGIPAAILGWMELDAIKNGKSSESGRWMAQVGLWGGIAVTVIIGGLWLVYLLMVMMASANPYGY